ncbi:MAG TPA: glucoamylase family protein [Terriglobia bacterium]|nr:glucoamylase family protein [Terriglobia bacterium]
MARIFDKHSHTYPKTPDVNNGHGNIELPLDAPAQVKQTSDEFRKGSLRALGVSQAQNWITLTGNKRSKMLKPRWRKAEASVERASQLLREVTPEERPVTEEQRWILDNARFLRGASKEVRDALKSFQELPSLQSSPDQGEIVPRVYEIATGFLIAVGLKFEDEAFGEYVAGVQQVTALQMDELWALKPLLQFVLLERLGIAAETSMGTSESENGPSEIPFGPPSRIITSLREISQIEWKEFFEANCVVEHIFQSDPAGAYPWMDFESRELYRNAVSDLVQHTTLSEVDVAKGAVLCARKAKERKWGVNQRAVDRRSNVGYYLTDHGVLRLRRIIGYRPSLKRRIKDLILGWPEVYYVAGVELTTLLAVFLLLWHLGTVIPLIPGLLLLIPASQAAVGLMNHLTVRLVPPHRLPRLDFSNGIPDEFSTLVVVPSLLLNEKEVRHIVESLEVRYLGNRDPNLHFTLLTDSPDTPEPADEHDDLVKLCSSLIEQLNTKYGHDRQGGFFHLHRHRLYNPQENRWMGWERKRGKLLDLNKLILGEEDNFPVKVGDLSVLPKVRYVITLDSDTRLPRDTAYRLIGTLAHPLNRAVIDRKTNTVVEGYGILQPRVGISIESARKSRLASIYSGETGFDIYTRAVSDVYQDLFGEGSFTGKGIYEVDTFQRVLGNRFPSNALLSHDLIEGVYGRAGLVSDVEVIDDYPSHFSAYCRRMHRWVRGDWQILRWLLHSVPNFFGRRVPNPITPLSRWKIFDNIRRSLVELNLFLLLLAGWFFFPGGALYWTVITLALLLIPTYTEALIFLLQVRRTNNLKAFLKERKNALVGGHLQVFVMLVFLPHKAFVMLDAIVRTLTRLTVTRRNLLEWETAAEAEAGTRKKTAVEVYLDLTPWFALAAGVSLALLRPSAVLVAAPVLSLWLLAGAFTKWINKPPSRRKKPLRPQDVAFLRLASLTTWRYFREFSNAGVHWLIPDRVQEAPPAVMNVISPTNLGILLNARLAAHRLGYLTLAELIQQTEETISSTQRLSRFEGHFLNWYDVETLKPLPPNFVSTVDSGNLAACLWTLKQACLGLINEPLLPMELWQGIRDHISLVQQLVNQKTLPPEVILQIQGLTSRADRVANDSADWIKSLPELENQVQEVVTVLRSTEPEANNSNPSLADELSWWLSETLARIANVRSSVETLAPWLLPEYRQLKLPNPAQEITLALLPSVVSRLERQLNDLSLQADRGSDSDTNESLRSRLSGSLNRGSELSARLQYLALGADKLLKEMDFRFLYDRKKKLLRVGFDVDAQQPARSFYDLLGSEARTATFIAIAKGDIKQEAWFHLGRARALERGEAALVSWSGTMFEYLMPFLWMRSYSGTMLDESMLSAVACQQKYARIRNVPWGVSEAAYSARDHKGIYQYAAFGLPGLAVDPNALKDIVIAPYASFLALPVDSTAAARNLRWMWKNGWRGRFGFYESADYSTEQAPGMKDYELIRCWMAHHQGMSLLAVCNLLTQSSLQRWFHLEPQVMATELLLHEKVPYTAPEEAGLAGHPQQSPHNPAKEAAIRSSLAEPAHESG